MTMPPVALLAGGLATRLFPLTEAVPKSMVLVAGHPFIAHQLRLLAKQGVGKVVLCIGHLGKIIQDFVGDGRDFGVNVVYSDDGKTALGTGGALRQALSLLGDRFLVMYGDSYLPTAFAPVVRALDQPRWGGVMTVFCNQGRWDRSNVLFDRGCIQLYDKVDPTPQMRHIDYGLGALRAQALSSWPKGQAFDLADVYGALLAQNRLGAVEVVDRFYEIGSPSGLSETEAYIAAMKGSWE